MKKRSVIVSVILILLLLGMAVGVMAAERGPGAQVAVRPGPRLAGDINSQGSVGRQTARPAVETTA